MKQPKIKLSDFDSFVGGVANRAVKVMLVGATDYISLHVGTGKTPKKAYKSAAKKLRKLAREADKKAKKEAKVVADY